MFQHLFPFPLRPMVALSAFLLLGMPVRSQDPVSNAPQREMGAIKVIRDVTYREGASEAWRLDLAMPAERTEELRPALVIMHGGGTDARPHGGEYTAVALAWLDWQLKGSKLKRDSRWSLEAKNFTQ